MKKKRKIKFSGKLKSYMQWPLFMVLFLMVMNLLVYFVNIKAGLIVSMFGVAYCIIALFLSLHYKPGIMNEMIYFATQYGQVQKKLLEEFEIPYALLDPDGRLIWMNNEFGRITGKDKKYRKNIQYIFPEIDSPVLPSKRNQNSIDLTFNDRDYHGTAPQDFCRDPG